jgi:hypothetical protein
MQTSFRQVDTPQHRSRLRVHTGRTWPPSSGQHPRRRFLSLAAGAAAVPAISRIARAQAYPSRPVRVIVPVAAGGSTDISARVIAQWLSERLGRQFIVENRSGGGGNIGTEAVVRAAPDGYTLLMVDASPAINATLYDKLNFNFIRDIAPVAGVIRSFYVMEVNPLFPAKTVPEFIAYAKSRFLPTPDWGLAFSQVINSFTSAAGIVFLAKRTCGMVASDEIGAKSFNRSYGSEYKAPFKTCVPMPPTTRV